ncbi:MAG: DUF748 domain-containing protein [Steroidobacteraceae bacterium]
MLHLLKSKTIRILAAAALAVGLYAAAGFLLAPKLLRSALLENIPKTLGVVPTVGEIRINPFLLQLEVKDFSLAGKGGEKLLGFERLFVDFELSSLWHRAYTFGRIELGAPHVNATIARDGTLNLLQLRPPSKPPEHAASNEALPTVRIGSFKVAQGSLSYEDRSRPSEFAARLQPINFELRDFTTGAAGGLFTLTGTSDLGERLEWHGHVSVQPIESDGELRVTGWRAHRIWEYFEDRLNFVINSGSGDLEATYKFSLKDAVDLRVDVSKATITDLAIRPRDSDSDWISVPGLTLSGASADLSKRQASVDSLSLTGMKLVTWLEPDRSFNLLRLAAAPTAAPAVAPAPAAATSPWQFDLRRFELHDASVSAEDRGTHPAAKIVVAPISLQVNGISLDLTKPLRVALDTHIGESGSLTLTGEVTPQPTAASLSLKLAGIDLTAAQPYIAQYTSMTLRSGQLGAEVQLRYGSAAKQMPALQFEGDLHVDNLHTVDNVLHDDFINWQRLDVHGLTYQQNPGRLDIAEVVAQKPYARIIIESDTSLNVKRVLAGPGLKTATAPSTPAPSAPAPRAKAVAAKSAAAGDAPSSNPNPNPMPMSIKKILLHGGQANFTDRSVTPNFSAGIQALDGTVLGLSSKANSRATVDLHGEVDAFSPVSVSGEVNVLSAALYTDLKMNFDNIELSIFNPYSGKFAGYNITKGKLTTELHYKVDGRKLDAQHHIVIDQLEFGDKTASKDAVSLPVKLAVALLRDRNGVIDLNLPVAGSLDDPKFRLAPIIWKVLVNILEKAVTAPFALLGALFGGGPDIQFVDFQPGVGTLDAAAADKVKTVAKALNARPQLKIDVPIAVVPDIDRPALLAAQFNAQLNEVQMAGQSRKKPSAGALAPAFEQLSPAAQLELLTQLYTRDVGAQPKYPDAVAALKKTDAVPAKIEFLTSAIREHLTVGDAELKALGEQRALALQQALLTGTQVEPERVFLVANDKAVAKDGVVRLELSLK